MLKEKTTVNLLNQLPEIKDKSAKQSHKWKIYRELERQLHDPTKEESIFANWVLAEMDIELEEVYAEMNETLDLKRIVSVEYYDCFHRLTQNLVSLIDNIQKHSHRKLYKIISNKGLSPKPVEGDLLTIKLEIKWHSDIPFNPQYCRLVIKSLLNAYLDQPFEFDGSLSWIS